MARNYQAEYERRLQNAARKHGLSLEEARGQRGFASQASSHGKETQTARDLRALENPWMDRDAFTRLYPKILRYPTYQRAMVTGLRRAQRIADFDKDLFDTTYGTILPIGSKQPPGTHRRRPTTLPDARQLTRLAQIIHAAGRSAPVYLITTPLTPAKAPRTTAYIE